MKYSLLSNIIAWVFHDRSDRKIFRKFCSGIDERVLCEKRRKIIYSRYPNTVEKLKKDVKTRQLKVVFLCAENSKWSYQSLYEELDKNPNFEPQILITLLKPMFLKKHSYEFINVKQFLTENYEFFKSKGMNVDYAFDFEKNKYIDLKEFKPDIIFYEQPWDIADVQAIWKTSEFALCCHCSYGTSITTATYEFNAPFYRYLYKYFLDNEFIRDSYVNVYDYNSENVPVTGSLKLDAYRLPLDTNNIKWKTEGKKRVIWAPHHSFSKDSILKYGTFDRNYNFFLDIAKNHQEIEFILKPHPILKHQILEKKLMTKVQMEDYFKQWENLPNAQIIEGGNYFDMFRTSDMLITDSCSFLSEYLPLGKPVIHLISNSSSGLNGFGNKITQGYYKALNLNDLKRYIDEVLINNNDTLKDLRIKSYQECFNNEGQSSAVRIVNHLANLFNI